MREPWRRQQGSCSFVFVRRKSRSRCQLVAYRMMKMNVSSALLNRCPPNSEPNSRRLRSDRGRWSNKRFPGGCSRKGWLETAHKKPRSRLACISVRPIRGRSARCLSRESLREKRKMTYSFWTPHCPHVQDDPGRFTEEWKQIVRSHNPLPAVAC